MLNFQWISQQVDGSRAENRRERIEQACLAHIVDEKYGFMTARTARHVHPVGASASNVLRPVVPQRL
jgi:hypothetical protein